MYSYSNPVHESPESMLCVQPTGSFAVHIFGVSESFSLIEYSNILLFLYLQISNNKTAHIHPMHRVIIKHTLYAHITLQLNNLLATPTQRNFSRPDAQ